jgi:hypothetical protein
VRGRREREVASILQSLLRAGSRDGFKAHPAIDDGVAIVFASSGEWWAGEWRGGERILNHRSASNGMGPRSCSSHSVQTSGDRSRNERTAAPLRSSAKKLGQRG